MKVGWLADNPGYIGGAEMTASEFRAASPESVEIVDCPAGAVVRGCDVYVVHNAVHYHAEELEGLPRVVKYAHDVCTYSPRGSREWLVENAEWIFCSPLQRDHMGLDGECIPPALNLSKFRPPRQHTRNGKRLGTCTIAQWRNPDKGAFAIEEWAQQNGIVHAYGPGEFHPKGEAVDYRGDLGPSQDVAQTLWAHERFVFLPTAIEPFCRTVVEAFVAGCEVVTNRLVGARHWIQEDPKGLETASEDFWEVVLCGS